MSKYRKILIAYDNSEEFLKKGIAVAGSETCWVTVLKVLPRYEGDAYLIGIKDIGEVITSKGDKVMEEIDSLCKAKGYPAKVQVEYGEASERILDVAEEQNCDLIIVEGKKMNWLDKLVKGNVVERIVDNATCPVLVLR